MFFYITFNNLICLKMDFIEYIFQVKVCMQLVPNKMYLFFFRAFTMMVFNQQRMFKELVTAALTRFCSIVCNKNDPENQNDHI